MTTKLYVGNLSYNTTEVQLRELFANAGDVASVSVIMDPATGRGRGFGFVEMSSPEQAREAIRRFDGYTLNERALKVNEARPREDRPNRNFGSRGGGSRSRY